MPFTAEDFQVKSTGFTAADFEDTPKPNGTFTSADFAPKVKEIGEFEKPSLLNAPVQAEPQLSDTQLIGEGIKAIGGGIKDQFQNFVRRSQPTSPSVAADPLAAPDQNFIGAIRDIPLETSFPSFSTAREGGIPIVSDIFPQTKGVVPPIARSLTTGVGTILDTFLNVFRIAPKALDQFFGVHPEIPFSSKVKQAMKNNDFFADRIIKADVKMLQPRIDEAIEAGQDPELVAGLIKTRLVILGMLTDVGEAEVAGGLAKLPGKAAAGLQKEARFASATGTRAAEQARRAARPKKTAPTSLPKSEKLNIIERAANREKAKLEKALEPFKEQGKGRGIPKDEPFTPFDKNLGKAAQETLKQARKKKGKITLKAKGFKDKGLKAGTKDFQRIKIENVDKGKGKGVGLKLTIDGKDVPVKTVKEASKIIRESSAKAISEGKAGTVVQSNMFGGLSKAEQKAFRPSKKLIDSFKKKSLGAKLKSKKGELTLPEKQELAALNKKTTLNPKETARVTFLQAKAALPAGPKGESPVARRAREKVEQRQLRKDVTAQQAKVTQERVIPKESSGTGKPVKAKKTKELFDFEKESLDRPEKIVPAVKETFTDTKGRKRTRFVGGTVIGEKTKIPLGKLVAEGHITDDLAEGIAQATKLDKNVLKALEKVTDEAANAQAVTKSQVDFIKTLQRMTPEERASIPGVSFKAAKVILDNPKIDPLVKADRALGVVEDMILLRNALGTMFRRLDKSTVKGQDLLTEMRKLIDDERLPQVKRNQLQDAINRIGRGEERVNIFDVANEIGVNNMLLSIATIKRNLVGNLVGVGFQPLDKLGQAIISVLLPGKLSRKKGAFAEVSAIIAGQLKSLPKATSRGIKFSIFGDTENIVRHIQRKIDKLNIGPKTAITSKKIRRLKAELKFELREKDIGRISEARIQTGQAFTTRRIFGSKFEKEHPKFTRVFDTVGAVQNIATRLLSGGDKFFSEIARGGAGAARKVQNAMKKNPSAWRDEVRKIKLTNLEKRGVAEAAMEYVFRDKMGRTMTAASNFISKVRPFGIPVGKIVVPFFKTIVKLARFTWNRSPFKFIEEVGNIFFKRSAKGEAKLTLRGFDAEEGGKALMGSAIMIGLGAYVWGQNGRFVGASKNRKERDLTRMRDLEEIRIEWLDGKGNVVGTTPMNNLLPLTPFVSALASIENGRARIAKGDPINDVYGVEANRFMKSMLQQSVYNNLNEIDRATENFLAEKLAVNEDGSVDEGAARSAFQKYLKRLVAGRALPAELANIRRTGDFLGLKKFGIEIFEEDRRIIETSGAQVKIPFTDIGTGIPTLGAIGEEVSTRIPRLKSSKKKGTARIDFTGEEALRSRPVSFMEFIKGSRAPKDDKLLTELAKLDIIPGQAPRSKTIPIQIDGENVKTRLTEQERREFTKRAGKFFREAGDRFVNSPAYPNLDVKVKRRFLKAFRDIGRGPAGTVEGFKAFKRQLKSVEGRKQLDKDTFEGFHKFFTDEKFTPFQTNPK